MQFHPLLVLSAANALTPTLIGQVPLDRLPQRIGERMTWAPTKFGFDLPRIDRVPPVMSRTVWDELDQVLVRAAGPRPEFVEEPTDREDHVEVLLLAAAANIVGFPDAALRKDRPDSSSAT
jgi:hypothetical protein